MVTLYQVDSFTDVPFAGNPAGVCLLTTAADDAWMQNVAREMNLSETAFLVARPDASFDLRWFTPSVEVDLCGHATLASAHVLWETGVLAADEAAIFGTKSGRLTCRRDADWISMDFPATPPEFCPAPAGLAEALGITPVAVGRTPFDLLVEVDSEATVRAMAPDFGKLAAFDVRGIMVTSRADAPSSASGRAATYDFISRFFGPAVGINEDPVTGSAHCALGPYWSERLGKSDLLAYQASARGGVVRVSPRGGRVILGGQAVTVLRCELVV